MANGKPLKRGNRAVVNEKMCKPCDCLGKCVEACKFLDAISRGDNGWPIVDLYKCCGCGDCAEECPNKAIKILWIEIAQSPDSPGNEIATW